MMYTMDNIHLVKDDYIHDSYLQRFGILGD